MTAKTALQTPQQANRERIRTWRKNLSLDEVRDRSRKLCKNLMDLPSLKNPEGWIAGYRAMVWKKEASLEEIWAGHSSPTQENRWVFPRVHDRGQGQMDFFVADPQDDSQWEENRLGILEPLSTRPIVQPEKIRVMLIPGLAFSSQGARIGHGSGYYDRFLERHRDIYKIGACLDEQFLNLNAENSRLLLWEEHPWDVRMDCIVTDKSTYVLK